MPPIFGVSAEVVIAGRGADRDSPETSSCRELVERVARRGEAALQALVERHWRGLVSYV